jgi:hypothetical protein
MPLHLYFIFMASFPLLLKHCCYCRYIILFSFILRLFRRPYVIRRHNRHHLGLHAAISAATAVMTVAGLLILNITSPLTRRHTADIAVTPYHFDVASFLAVHTAVITAATSRQASSIIFMEADRRLVASQFSPASCHATARCC